MKVIGYTRVSTAEQAKDGWTLTQQRNAIEAECERRGWTLIEVIEDAGYSGTNDCRPGLRRALDMLKRRQARAIAVARLDRLARSTQHLCEYIAACKKQKWSMVALDVDLDTTTANGRFMVRVLAAVAEWESEVNGERVREGMAEARASGKVFGFQAQVEPATVTRITRARRRGDSFAVIAKRLDAARVPTPGGGARWYPSTIERICKREAVA
ncbi:recombinase family protein [Nocardioides agariphilus]|uniref:Recombinase family protein n=1 Tax=Nocardioides agariphilus TaxID=433664 RepID=A0A930VIT8_9ACTN|nr:recombinase family protein [Nocardioides agariphilus]MBF4768339.1 recombinase family protein [Nocardioides agariphilus]